jgi:tRNA threonylcarbamoyladenosine biosynthesis protein TsaB
MILLWNSADMEVELLFVGDGRREEVRWQADRNLARDMLAFLRDECARHNITMSHIQGIGVFRGPGSFTGLRIGLTVLTTWARAEHIPIVGEVGEDWQELCLDRLARGEDDGIVLPEYGAPARVTKPRK